MNRYNYYVTDPSWSESTRRLILRGKDHSRSSSGRWSADFHGFEAGEMLLVHGQYKQWLVCLFYKESG